MAAADEVRQASEQFYAALSQMANSDASAMSAVWAHNNDVTALHPIGGRNEGWDETRSAFEQVGSLASGGRFSYATRSSRSGRTWPTKSESRRASSRWPASISRSVTASPTSIDVRTEPGRWSTTMPISRRQ
jgi:hypothetical protein